MKHFFSTCVLWFDPAVEWVVCFHAEILLFKHRRKVEDEDKHRLCLLKETLGRFSAGFASSRRRRSVQTMEMTRFNRAVRSANQVQTSWCNFFEWLRLFPRTLNAAPKPNCIRTLLHNHDELDCLSGRHFSAFSSTFRFYEKRFSHSA